MFCEFVCVHHAFSEVIYDALTSRFPYARSPFNALNLLGYIMILFLGTDILLVWRLRCGDS